MDINLFTISEVCLYFYCCLFLDSEVSNNLGTVRGYIVWILHLREVEHIGYTYLLILNMNRV